MIGGFDQFHYFVGCAPEQTRAEVRRCFEAAGPMAAIPESSDHTSADLNYSWPLRMRQNIVLIHAGH
jgi:hypothetical protein